MSQDLSRPPKAHELFLEEQPRPALDVADWFIEYSGYTKTSLQIQKLAYIAHGYMLGIHGVPLVRDQVQAWKLGPVFPEIYWKFKRWKFNPIGTSASPAPFTTMQQDVMENVFASYGRFCGYYLSDITHENSDGKTPWTQCYVEGAKYTPIPDDITEEYYRQLHKKHGYDY